MLEEMRRLPAGLTALDGEGRAIALVDLANVQPVLLCLLRHFG